MRFVLIAALKDLRRRIADPAALMIWVGLPIVIGGLMSLLSTGGGPAPKARLLLVDEDNTLLSGLVARAGQQGQLSDFIEIVEVNAADGRARIDAGDGSALLVIPKGFQEGVLRERPTTLTLLTNPAQRILPGILEEGLRMALEATFYLQRLAGPEVRRILDGAPTSTQGPSDDLVASVSRAINQRLRALQTTLLPPVITLETKAEKSEDSPSTAVDFGALFLPGLLFMALLFTAQGMSIDVWTEKTHGTLRRTLSTPQGAGAWLAGKLLAGVAIMTTAALAALILGVLVFNVSLVRAPFALAWAAFAGAALLCYMMLIQMISTSARGAQLLSSLIVFPLIMMGGSFFPFEVMPAWMANIGRWTPNGMGVTRLKALLFGPIDPLTMLVAVAAIGVPAAIAFFVSVRRLTGAFAIN